MDRASFFGKDLITTQEWSVEELEEVLKFATELKQDRFSDDHLKYLKNRTFIMFFYNPSLRTRQSFEAAATELGGHAQFLVPDSVRLKTKKSAGETIEDAAKVMERYACGIGIRILETSVEKYGDGNALVREYARWANIPIVNMADDMYHPCQGLADVMGIREHYGGNIKGKRLLQIWGHGALARSYCSVHESLLINSRLGMDITLAYPKGYDLDPEIISMVKKNCEANGRKFEIIHDPVEGYEGADVVYSRNWFSPEFYQIGKEEEIKRAMKYTDWICDEKKMKLTNNGIFVHPMPVDRGSEVTDEVASGPRSIIYDIAENRLHVQKAIMALTMSDYFIKHADYQ